MKRRGFSMVEILVILTVLGVIAGIAIPTALRARKASEAPTCQVNMSRISSAAEQYAAEAAAREDAASTQTLTLTTLVEAGLLSDHVACPTGAEYQLKTRRDGTIAVLHKENQ
jgi:prepilin-type N-terminal cleavage/methylation domain-containing protein